MDSTTNGLGLPNTLAGLECDLHGLYAELQKLSDKRHARGKRYDLALVLLLVVLAKLCGEDHPYGIAQWLIAHTQQLITLLDLSCSRLPSPSTYRRILNMVDAEQLQAAVIRFLASARAKGQDGVVSIDGKTLRGSVIAGQGQPLHVLTAYLPGRETVLRQEAIGAKENELVAAPRLLEQLDLQGKIVTGDAMFTQGELSAQIVEAGADYVWMVKRNQPKLREDIAQLFAPCQRTPGHGLPSNDFQTARQQGKSHGRLEERELICSEQLNDYLPWPYVGQVLVIRRKRTKANGLEETETVYGVTSLRREEANAQQLLRLVRGHWHIENKLFHRRDVTLREDALHTKFSTLAQVMAVLNNLIIGLVSACHWRYLPAARRYFTANLSHALALLL